MKKRENQKLNKFALSGSSYTIVVYYIIPSMPSLGSLSSLLLYSFIYLFNISYVFTRYIFPRS